MGLVTGVAKLRWFGQERRTICQVRRSSKAQLAVERLEDRILLTIELRHIQAAQNADGRLEVFALATQDLELPGQWVVYSNSQRQPGGVWGGWGFLDGPGGHMTEIVVARNQDGRLQVIGGAVGPSTSGGVRTTSQVVPGGAWSGWSQVGGAIGGIQALDVAGNADGRLEVFTRIVSPSSPFNSSTQERPGGVFGEWGSIGVPPTSLRWGDVVQNADGRLELFGIANDNTVYGHSQRTPGGAWGDWGSIGGPGFTIRDLRAAQNLDGRLEVFASKQTVLGNGNGYINSQMSPGGAWGEWGPIGPELSVRTNQIEVARNLDGRLEVFARGSDNRIYINSQTSPGGAWGGWGPIEGGPGVSLREIAVAQNADGRLEVFALALSNEIFINSQTQPGGAWGEWGSIGAPSSPLRADLSGRSPNGDVNFSLDVGHGNDALTLAQLRPVHEAAIARWTTALGNVQLETLLSRVTVHIVDLALPYLALATPEAIWVDRGAAGHGWFIDATPADDAEFVLARGPELWALEGSPAAGRFDLLTTLLHELGHVLGYEHTDGPGLMEEALVTGVRRLPHAESESARPDQVGFDAAKETSQGAADVEGFRFPDAVMSLNLLKNDTDMVEAGLSGVNQADGEQPNRSVYKGRNHALSVSPRDTSALGILGLDSLTSNAVLDQRQLTEIPCLLVEKTGMSLNDLALAVVVRDWVDEY